MCAFRGRIGFISPAGDTGGTWEYYKVLPEGVAMIFVNCAVSKLVSEDLKKAFALYPAAAEHLANQECDVILVSGALLFAHVGYEHAQETFQKIRETVKSPVIVDLEAQFDALRAVGANKIVISAPYEAARTEERRKLCESVGFKVLNTKSLGMTRRWEIQQQSPYVTYRQAKEAFFEAPEEADAIYICCPEWPTISIIEKLENDTGKPVITYVGADMRAALRAIHIREPIKGYGKILELM